MTGLVVWPTNLDVAASDAKVMSAYTEHQGIAMTQNLLVEGAAAIALLAVAIALAGQPAVARSLDSRPRPYPCRWCRSGWP